MMKTPAWTWRRRILLAYFTKHPAGETRQDACLNVARRSLEWTNYANALRKQFLRTLCVKKPFGRQKTIFSATHRRVSHRIPSVSRETAKKQEKPTLLDTRSKETALRYLNSSSSERPKHYLSAHPIARWRCALTALCRCILSNPCWRILIALRWYALIAPHGYVRPCHFSATQNKSGDNAHTICPPLCGVFDNSRKCFTWNICGYYCLNALLLGY